MSTNPVLVPVSLVSQFLTTEKMASRHWLQCQMECLLDQVFDQLSTKFEDYLASNAITGTAHHTTIDTETIQQEQRNEPYFQAHSHTQFRAPTDHLSNTDFPVVVRKMHDRGQMSNVNEQVNQNGIHSETRMFDQVQYPLSLSVLTSNLDQMNQNDLDGGDDQRSNRHLNDDIDNDAAQKDRIETKIKEEIDDSNDKQFITDQSQHPHLLSLPTLNFEQSNQNYDEEDYGLNEANVKSPNNHNNASLVDNDEIEVKEEMDNTDGEIVYSDQNSQIALPAFESASNEQPNNNWKSENDEEYDLDGTRDDELEYGDIEDAQMDSDEVEVKEEIDYTNNQLSTTYQPPNQASLPTPTSNVDQSNKKYVYDGLDGDVDQSSNEHPRDANDDNEMNEHYEEHSRPRKKARLDTIELNNRQSRVTRQSSRLANRDQTDPNQHINEHSNSGGRQSNEPTEPSEEADETNQVNNQDNQIITISLQCLHTDCSLTFNNKTELNLHMSTRHQILPHRCFVKDCKQSFFIRYKLGDHVKQVHSNTTQWHCDKCPNQFPTYKQLSTHNYHYHQLGQYQCAFTNCTFTGEQRQKIYTHYRDKHKTVEFTCNHSNCGRRFNNKSNFNVHQRAHLGIKPYRCKWPSCGYAAINRSNTIAHIKNVHLKQGSTEPPLVDPREYLEVVR